MTAGKTRISQRLSIPRGAVKPQSPTTMPGQEEKNAAMSADGSTNATSSSEVAPKEATSSEVPEQSVPDQAV